MNFTGKILRPARSSNANSRTTSPATSGVLNRILFVGNEPLGGSSAFVLPDRDVFSALNRPESEEFLVWAANSSSLSVLEDPDWQIEGQGEILPGSETVGNFNDGSRRIRILESRDIAGVIEVSYINGDTGLPDTAGVDSVSGGVVAVTDTLSLERGDSITSVTYFLASSRFWWTRNDPQRQRFDYDGAAQRWKPLAGSGVVPVGVVEPGAAFRLTPRPFLPGIGEVIEGEPGLDTYSMIRVGAEPNASDSFPISTGIEYGTGVPYSGTIVVSDDDIEEFVFPVGPTPPAAAVSPNGTFRIHPSLESALAGLNVWFFRDRFEGFSGLVSSVIAANDRDIHISPVPLPEETPILTVGNREPLPVQTFFSDSDLDSTTLPVGTVGVSMTTGKVKFSPELVSICDPGTRSNPNPDFDIRFLGANLYYRGVRCNRVSQPVRDPVVLQDESGGIEVGTTMYLPLSDFTGRSGVSYVPDGTGDTPDSRVTPSVRPNGSGMTRSLDSVGESFIFGIAGSLSVRVVDRDSDIPSPWKIPSGEAFISREPDVMERSMVRFNPGDVERFQDLPAYFLQSDFTPSVYYDSPRLVSRFQGDFEFQGGESLHLEVDGIVYQWIAPAGVLSAGDVADLLSALTGANVFTFRGRVVIEASISASILYGSIDIDGVITPDSTAASVLGFRPGQYADGNPRWTPDLGITFGFFRSGVESDNEEGTTDFKSETEFEGTLSSNLNSSVFVFLSQIPLEDRPGYDDTSYFKLVDGLSQTLLEPFQNIEHAFDEGRIAFLERRRASGEITGTTFTLGQQQVVPESLGFATGGSIRLAESGGEFAFLDENEYVLNPLPGSVTLTDPINAQYFSGYRGEFNNDALVVTQNPLAIGVTSGDRLEVVASSEPENEGSYIVTWVTSSEIGVTPSFPIPTGSDVRFDLYRGPDANGIDRSVLAKEVYKEWDHLPEDPFKIRILTPIGTTSLGFDFIINRSSISLDSGRDLNVRFGIEGDLFPVSVTRQESMGIVSGTLTLPDFVDTGLDRFQIRIGDDTFTPIFVPALSPQPSDIEFDPAGNVAVPDTLVSGYEAAEVFYIERLRDPSDIPSGSAMFDPSELVLRVSGSDALANPDTEVILSETLVTRGRKDAAVNPLNGSVTLAGPMLRGQVLEVEYHEADLSGEKVGDPVLERLPVFIRGEKAERVNDLVFQFNPTQRTLFEEYTPQIFVGSNLLGFGGSSVSASVLPDTSEIVFGEPVPADVDVTINYAVMEASGGETSYTTSRFPVYRPPFFIEEQEDRFFLQGNREQEFDIGALIRLGNVNVYVMDSFYDTDSDTTEIQIYPPQAKEIGSRSPGEDVLQLVTDTALIQVGLDPEDSEPVQGVMASFDDLTGSPAPYEDVTRGDTEIIFQADLSDAIVPGHILDLSGHPFTIVGVEVQEDGRSTRVKLASPTQRGFRYNVDLATVTVRPVYPPDSRFFVGRGPLSDTDFDLIRFTDDLPGKTLVPGRDYEVDPSNGQISLVPPFAKAFKPQEILQVSYSRLRQLKAKVKDGTLSVPRISADFAYVSPPSQDNGYLGQRLLAKFSYSSPDTFYAEVPATERFVADETARILEEIEAENGGFGVVGTSLERSQVGTVSDLSLVREQEQRDFVARSVSMFYNGVILSLEAVLETARGGVVGDRDGKFRMEVGTGDMLVPYGHVDPVTGVLNPRNVFRDLFYGQTGIWILDSDDIVTFNSASLTPNGLEGDFVPPDEFESVLLSQKSFIRNDIDDQVITSRVVRRTRRPRIGGGLNPLRSYTYSATGVFEPLSDPHRLSRIFPEQTTAFCTLMPGVGADEDTGDPGEYTFGRRVFGRRRRTTGTSIGQLSNPVMGVLGSVRQVDASPRYPRARVWKFSPTGFPEFDLLLGTDFEINPRPAIIATPVRLEEFPVDTSTGFPDFIELFSEGGDIPDLNTGDPDLDTPGFEPGQQIQIGIGDSFFDVEHPSGDSVVVDEVIAGCVITFSPGSIRIPEIEPVTEGDLIPFGATIAVTPPTGVQISPSDPPTVSELTEIATLSPVYQSGKDFRFRSNGEIIDATLPSLLDPSFLPLKEITGQNPPPPLSSFEAVVEFGQDATSPIRIPALFGQDRNDSGDYSLPYLVRGGSEIDLLRRVQVDTADLPPDEIRGLGEVNGATFDAGVPLPTISSGDLAFLEVPNSPQGSTGIFTVGAVTLSGFLPPRFVSPTSSGARIEYEMSRAVVWIGSEITGLSPLEIAGATQLSVAGTTVVFNDDTPATNTGGFYGLLDEAEVGVSFTIRILKRSTAPGPSPVAVVVESVSFAKISGTDIEVTGGLGSVTIPLASISFGQTAITIPADGFMDFAELEPLQPHDFFIDINAASGSRTERIEDDRITFVTVFDMRHAGERGLVHPVSGIDLETVLEVGDCESDTGNSSVNSTAEINGGDGFTFPAPLISGFVSGEGFIETPAFEGYSNTPITATDVRYGIAPSVPIESGTADFDGNDGVLEGVYGDAQPGDVLVVVENASGLVCETAGTYIVRHNVSDDFGIPSEIEFERDRLGFDFPVITAVDDVSETITVNGDVSTFPASGTLFLVVNELGLGTSAPSTVYSATYTSISGQTFAGLSGYADADGNPVPASGFYAVAIPGVEVSGMTAIPINLDSVYREVSGNLTVTISNEIASTSNTFTADTVGPDIDFSQYPEVTNQVLTWDLSGVDWTTVRSPGQVIPCLLPSDEIVSEYQIREGLYVERSTPRPSAIDYAGTSALVVDASRSLSPSQVGPRPVSENVSYDIRRIRRFSGEVRSGVFEPLLKLCASRRFEADGYMVPPPGVTEPAEVLSNAGTEFGDFIRSGVNVGDRLRLLDADRNVVEERVIVSVSPGSLGISPAFTSVINPGAVFEIGIQQFPVPYEQALDDGLRIVSDTILTRQPDYSTGDGGRSPLLNTLEDTGSLFSGVVEPGDYVVIDPAGRLEGPTGAATPSEVGAPPQGDRGIEAALSAGSPSALDDNRGFYRVISVSTNSVEVTGETVFSGPDGSDNKILGTPASPYVLYPTVSGSSLTGGLEGQNDLRPTAPADPATNSFSGNPESIEPYGYRVIRLDSRFRRETLELILALRERSLSWADLLRDSRRKSGSYDDFQSDEHITDIEISGDPFTGSGVLSDDFIALLEGEVLSAPYQVSSTALSVLDRRFFLRDELLDSFGYSDFGAGEGLPVLPEFIEEVLSATERLWDKRYAWIDYRTNRIDGTIPSITRAKQSLERKQTKKRTRNLTRRL